MWGFYGPKYLVPSEYRYYSIVRSCSFLDQPYGLYREYVGILPPKTENQMAFCFHRSGEDDIGFKD